MQIWVFNSFAESPELHNTHFMGCTCIGTSFILEQWAHWTKWTLLLLFLCVYFTSWSQRTPPALSTFSVLSSRESLKGKGAMGCTIFTFPSVSSFSVHCKWVAYPGKDQRYIRFLGHLWCWGTTAFFLQQIAWFRQKQQGLHFLNPRFTVYMMGQQGKVGTHCGCLLYSITFSRTIHLETTSSKINLVRISKQWVLRFLNQAHSPSEHRTRCNDYMFHAFEASLCRKKWEVTQVSDWAPYWFIFLHRVSNPICSRKLHHPPFLKDWVAFLL
jgi:hypothetical protein